MRFRLLPKDSPLGWTPYFWLVYLGFFLVNPWFRGTTTLGWFGHAVAVAVFLVLYFRGYWLSGAALLPIVAGMVAMGLVLTPFNAGAMVFFVYAAGFVGETGPPQTAVRWLALIVVIAMVQGYWLQLPIMAYVPVLFVSVIVGGPNIYFAEARRAGRRLREVEQERARAAERERIARDLHDVVGHTLSLIVLKSELASKLAARDPDRALREIRDVERISREALAEVRAAVQGYRAEGLAAELTRARAALEAAGVALEAEATPLALAPATEQALSLVLREAVTNVVRHARASRCLVRLHEDDRATWLEVADDGVGGSAAEGTGTAAMRARLAEVGGSLDRSAHGGMRLRACVPRPSAPGAPVGSVAAAGPAAGAASASGAPV
ncbi:MAG: sensor histidine kinase [Vicinamibacteraceae bacterium]|nr:sensor histidine kinase [Vicinamibacteraceae bacterium]